MSHASGTPNALAAARRNSNGGSVLIKPNVNDYFLFPLVIPKYRYVYFTE